MNIVDITPENMFRPAEGEKIISLVPTPAGIPNYIIYPMHWIMTDRPNAFLCLELLGQRCPICRTDRRKQRVLINVWTNDERDLSPKVWDINLFLLSKGLGGKYSEDVLKDSKLWDPSKFGTVLDVTMKREAGKWPSYYMTKRLRRFEIPREVLDKAFDLRGLIL